MRNVQFTAVTTFYDSLDLLYFIVVFAVVVVTDFGMEKLIRQLEISIKRNFAEPARSKKQASKQASKQHQQVK